MTLNLGTAANILPKPEQTLICWSNRQPISEFTNVLSPAF